MSGPVRGVQTLGFRHDAVFYAGQAGFVPVVEPYVRTAIERDEPALLALPVDKIDLLRAALGEDAGRVSFVDIVDAGRNPAWLIPLWTDFVREQGGDGRSLWGVGEPVWPDRCPTELTECHRHEALLNVAFAEAPNFWLACPYDRAAFGAAVLRTAERTHPQVVDEGGVRRSATFGPDDLMDDPDQADLDEPRVGSVRIAFNGTDLAQVRDLVGRSALELGLGTRSTDFIVAANEVITNSIRHGGGAGVLRLWYEHGTLVCEVSDHGRISDPLVGRVRPGPADPGGRGLWMANRLCDLVQVRTGEHGTVVRLHLRHA